MTRLEKKVYIPSKLEGHRPMEEPDDDDECYRSQPRRTLRRPTPPPRRRPLLPRHGYDRPIPADPTFSRLCRDLALAAEARRQVKSSEIAPHYLPEADRLERESLKHLANYLAATAYAESK
jgi:hypothetical protein